MYSPKVIQKEQARIETETGKKLIRYERSESWNICQHLAKLYDHEEGKTKRALKPEEKDFIRNEILLCALDFEYWTRYCYVLADGAVGGGLQPLEIWESQRIMLNLISSLEEKMMEAFERGEPVDGILILLHKARQLGATMLARSLIMHRLTTAKHILAVTASVDDDKILKIYERDWRIIENLPWFLKPQMGFDEKAQHISFEKLDTSLLYQTYVQKAGIAQGEQYLLGHMTEVASNPYFANLEHDYFPAIPQSPYALHILESTAQGRGNGWHVLVNETRRGETRWKLSFIPYYAEPRKYRRVPPPNWTPSDTALQHAQKVHETSPEYIGRAVFLERETLYWWETTREEYARKGKLEWFLTNYCATIEESFQHTTQGAFESKLLEHFRGGATVPQAYEITA